MMRLKVLARGGVLTTAEWGCNDATTPPGSFKVTTPTFKFSALLTPSGAERLESMRV
jgi:hypothetical protein